MTYHRLRILAAGGLLCLLSANAVLASSGRSLTSTATMPSTNTPRPSNTWAFTEAPTDNPAATATMPPTNTPRPSNTWAAATATASPATASPAGVASIPARLCNGCTRIRLRASPGTAGDVLQFLDENAQLILVGRTADGAWLNVTVNSQTGWISAQYVRMLDNKPPTADNLAALPVKGVAVEASPTPTSNIGIPAWLSGVTSHARQIFLRGQQLGNRANVFSKVGDSITASPYFLTPIGTGQYELGAYSSLSSVIAYFSQANARTANSFANQSLAAVGGWSSFQLLQPAAFLKSTCGDDAPLVCEYKLVKPSVALIMVGTNDSGSGSPDQFAGNLSQIVQISIDMGVIPVLSTIPPKRMNADQAERAKAFNQVIRTIAQQNEIPLWDYWSVMDSLPNGGMSSDGLHPSIPPDGAPGRFTADNLQYGYTVRNLTALETLDVIWRLVLY